MRRFRLLQMSRGRFSIYFQWWSVMKETSRESKTRSPFVLTVNSPGHNQIWIYNFLQCDWSRRQPKHWFDRLRTKVDSECRSKERYGWDVPWRKVTACNIKPIKRDDFMRLSVRFTNINMIMIEEGFCKNAWTSDIKRPEATRRHRSKGKSREFEYLKYWYVLSGKV